jgi:hypothetical protein
MIQLTLTALESHLWQAANILRGLPLKDLLKTRFGARSKVVKAVDHPSRNRRLSNSATDVSYWNTSKTHGSNAYWTPPCTARRYWTLESPAEKKIN